MHSGNKGLTDAFLLELRTKFCRKVYWYCWNDLIHSSFSVWKQCWKVLKANMKQNYSVSLGLVMAKSFHSKTPQRKSNPWQHTGFKKGKYRCVCACMCVRVHACVHACMYMCLCMRYGVVYFGDHF